MRVVGLMSGTSYDAIDVAVADFSVQQDVLTLTPVGEQHYPLPDGLDQKIGSMVRGEPVTALDFCQLDTLIGQAFAEVASTAIEDIATSADLICSHGQTIYHWEDRGQALGSLQIGNPAWIAERTGIPVVADVRVRDIAAGGNGAPLASTFDVMLARQLYTHDVGFLNLGGIANMTIVPATGDPVAYDLGPANTLIDAAMLVFSDGAAAYDKDGKRAAAGKVHPALLQTLQSHSYYRLPLPKSTGKETFGSEYLQSLLSEFADVKQDDVLATLTSHVSALIGHEVNAHGLSYVVASGGGLNNPTLVKGIEQHLADSSFVAIDELGISSDAKEAYAFAMLGWLSVHGFEGAIASCTGAGHASVLGSVTPGRGQLTLPVATYSTKPRYLRINNAPSE